MSNKSGIVYIQRDKFDIYSPALGSVLEFRYVPEIIKDFWPIQVLKMLEWLLSGLVLGAWVFLQPRFTLFITLVSK